MPKPFEGEEGVPFPSKGAEKGSMNKLLPNLMEWLCDASYSDGTPMGQTQLMIRRQGSSMLAVLKIQDRGGLKVEAVDTSPDRALATLEAVLSAARVPWQKDPYPLGGDGKKKK